MSIQQVQNQNSLLQQLVLTLQKQLHAKNQQRKIIIVTLDRLTNQNDTIHKRYVQLIGENTKIMEKCRQQQQVIGQLQYIVGNVQGDLTKKHQQLNKYYQQFKSNQNTLIEQINTPQRLQPNQPTHQSQSKNFNQLTQNHKPLDEIIEETSSNTLEQQQPFEDSHYNNSKQTNDHQNSSRNCKCTCDNKTQLSTAESTQIIDLEMFKLLKQQHAQLQSQFQQFKLLHSEQNQSLLIEVKSKNQQIDHLNKTLQTLSKFISSGKLSKQDQHQQQKCQQQQSQQYNDKQNELPQQQSVENHQDQQQLQLTQSTAIKYLRQSLGHLGLDIDFTTIVKHIGLTVTQTCRQQPQQQGIEDNEDNENDSVVVSREIKQTQVLQLHNNHHYHPCQLSPRRLSPVQLRRPLDEQKMRSSNDSSNQYAQIVVYYQQQLAKLREQLDKVLQSRSQEEEVGRLREQVNNIKERNWGLLRINSRLVEERVEGQKQRLGQMKNQKQMKQRLVQVGKQNQQKETQQQLQLQYPPLSPSPPPSLLCSQPQTQISFLRKTITSLTQQLSFQHADAKQRQIYITELQQQLDSIDNQYNSQLMMLKKINAEINSELLMVKKQLFKYQKNNCGDLGKFIRENFMSKAKGEKVESSQRTIVRNNSSLRTFFYQANGIDPKIISSNNSNNNKSQQFIPSTFNNNDDPNLNNTNPNKKPNNNNPTNNWQDTTPTIMRIQPKRNNLTQYIYSPNDNSRIKSYLSNQDLDEMNSKSFNMGEMFMGRSVKPSRRANTRKFNTQKYKSLVEMFRTNNHYQANSPTYSISPHGQQHRKTTEDSPQQPQQIYSANNLSKANTLFFPQTNSLQYKQLIEQIKS